MYNYNYELTYNLENFENNLMAYQTDFLNVLNLKTYDNKKVNKIFDELYKTLKDNIYFKPIFEKKYKNIFFGFDVTQWSILPMLFCYETFKYTHICLVEYFKYNKVQENSIKDLENSLEQLTKK